MHPTTKPGPIDTLESLPHDAFYPPAPPLVSGDLHRSPNKRSSTPCLPMKRLFAWLLPKKHSHSLPPATKRSIPPDSEIRAEIGVPPSRKGLDHSVERCERDGDWDYRVYLTEGAEFYFGSEVFDALGRYFRDVEGVTDVHHMDREVYILRSRLPQDQLADHVWEAILRASESTLAYLSKQSASAPHN